MQKALKNLMEIAKRLRAEGGCPWDREQTLESLLPCLSSETDEVLEAVREGDPEEIKKELGDLLFCIVLMSLIAEEKGWFSMKEILERNAEKLVSRHTWVFGDDKAETAEEALALWKKNKAKE